MFPFFARLFGRRIQRPHLHDRRRTRTFKATQLKRIPLSACVRRVVEWQKGSWVNRKHLQSVLVQKNIEILYLSMENTCNIFNILPISIVYPSQSMYIYIYIYKQVVSIYCVYLCTCKTWSTGTNLTCWGIFLERFTSPKLPFGPILGSFLLGSLMRFLVERIVERFEVYLTSLNPPARFYQNSLRLTFQIDLPSFWHQKGWMNTVDRRDIS